MVAAMPRANASCPAAARSAAGRRRLRRNLLPRFETALRAAARLLHDLVGVDRAAQLGDAFDARARGSLGGNARGCHRRANFVGFAPGTRAREPELLARKSPSRRYRRPSGATSPAAKPPQL